jgi:precorrin-6B methylase 2
MTMLQVTRSPDFKTQDTALLGLLAELKAQDYHFVTATPATHARVITRCDRQRARSLRDVMGWSLPFARDLLEPRILSALQAGDVIYDDAGGLRSRVRVSSLHDDLYIHSAYPTSADDAVFFGPDSYRFAELIRDQLEREAPRTGAHIVDIGTGAGVGAIVAARTCPGAQLTMTDINPKALRFARINAAAAGVTAESYLGADLAGITAPINIVLANPPYIIDDAKRDYRDGGAMHGAAVALEMAQMAVERLALGGKLILYTGTAIIDGSDPLQCALEALSSGLGCSMNYRELDPDVFGEELTRPVYADVERIAVAAVIIERKGRR